MGLEMIALGTGLAAAATVGSAVVSYKQSEEAKKAAKSEAAKTDAKLKKQQDLIDEETKKQEAVAGERKERLAKRDLLFGAETGITGEQTGSLLS